MISKKIGIVDSIVYEDFHIQEIKVIIENKVQKAINYISLTGNVNVGDELLLNTTAVELNLGTGGAHFVIANLNNLESSLTGGGHIMKLRYTPFQLKVFAAEEQESKYHDIINNFKSLDNLPVAVGTLHSMLVPFVAVIKKADPTKKIAYIMTDGAALPIHLSKNVKQLKQKKLIDATITIGNSFGGDYECVNIYTALIVAKEIIKADVVFVSMGPGIVGTGTKYGFSGIEQGYILDAVVTLGGEAIAIPRISFADKRDRHKGISHHTITILKDIVKSKVIVPINIQDSDKKKYIYDQIKHNKIEKHKFVFMQSDKTKECLEYFKLNVKSMGRSYEEDEEFFKSSSGAGAYILEGLK
ncbi:Protein of unknown function [Alkalithermobacter thermoalcaliphilus JW-YL-7 = DSM 7308]|uniref:DUF3866 family protein n=1 Tax=Alkalithermobacter thermoalcaliphilus JW-YL-7 = DSM 7308 TaxID=1121328 RepID=A0A150FPV6_CLOPD|nr:Protein of unknown function DUF3866 [[Clostridium] paradoxum JW-YL-7 = DSM 7308]SHK65690.1 Protein of unknown function [[Clostridium] paradoxum JW-YL-7 = DSM 7308]